jgi:hypothetical protein
MPVPSNQPQDTQTIMVVVIFLACLCVVYWRTALRVIAVALVALAIYGAITGLHGLHHA